MKANELRIGNWVIHKDVIQYVQSICDTDSGRPDACLSEHDNGCKDLKPIPLTEEWLIKFGFKKNGLWYELNRIAWCVQDCRVVKETGAKDNPIYNDITKVKYVHQLQNLYFALTGDELTIKE